jgi:uncharacterized protein
MFNWKHSFYNINLKEEGYKNAKENEYYNVLMGKFAVIPKNVDLDNPPEELKGFLVPSEINQAEILTKQQHDAIYNDYPSAINLTVCPTSACNYKCEYCFEKNKSQHSMDAELIADTINYIKTEIDRNQNLKTFGIKWFGGEPLLNIPAIEQISRFVIDYCQEHNISYTAFIITNGYYYTKGVSEQLKTLKIKTVQISLDGFADDYARTRQVSKDAYERVLNNIENSVIPVVIRINTTRQNKDIVPTLVREIAKMPSVKSGFNKIMVARVKDYCTTLNYGFTDAEWIDFRKCYAELQDVIPPISKVTSAKYIPCGNIQKRHAVIGADGFLYRCDNHIGDIKYAIGTVKEGVVENSVDKKYVCSTITEECKKCKMLPICAGGSCRYEELLQGKPCYLVRERFKQNMTHYLTYVREP